MYAYSQEKKIAMGTSLDFGEINIALSPSIYF